MSKLRNVLTDDLNEDVCLDDVIKALVSTSKRMSALEHKSSAYALREAKRGFREAERKFLEFKKRLNGPITEEIIKIHSKIDKPVRHHNLLQTNFLLIFLF